MNTPPNGYGLSAEDQLWAEDIFQKLHRKLQAECERTGSNIPYTPKNGRYHDLDIGCGIYWWTNGFWPGMLWQMYHATGWTAYRTAAEGVELRLDEALEGYEDLHHDVGFMWLHTAVANYRLTGNEKSRKRGLKAANLLAGRYNPAGKFIRAWNGDNAGWMIVDCMMNIPLLYWASREINDPRYAHIAVNHADTCRHVTVRPDGSSNHITILDPETGELLDNPGGQGYGPGSSWSRGQAWAIYGFALSSRHGGRREHLDTAKRIAHYFIANLAVSDWLPLVDFRAPAEPVKYDTTAAMCAACGLLEIASQTEPFEKRLYANAAIRILRACEKAFSNWNPDEDGIMTNGAVAYHSTGDEANAPIIYGDYFFTESILRLLNKEFFMW